VTKSGCWELSMFHQPSNPLFLGMISLASACQSAIVGSCDKATQQSLL